MKTRDCGLGLLLTLCFACGAPAVQQDQTERGVGPGAAAWRGETIAGMSVRLYEPAGPVPAAGRGLMVVLHGCAQQATAIGDSGNWGDTADRYQWVIAAPNVPGGGVLAGCWDYYGNNHSRTNKYNDDVLALVQSLVGQSALGIDPNQVYISGLSSGASQAMVLGCLAPDVFAGVGINAGPTVGTTSGQIGSVATSQAAAVALCRSFASSQSAALSTQLTSIVYGNNDFTVAPGYNRLNADVMAQLYGATGPSTFSTGGLVGANPAGQGWQWDDGQGPRVRLIENTGLGHNWPSGSGTGGAAFVNGNSLDYPEELAQFFSTENRRISGDRPPALNLNLVQVQGDQVRVEGQATDDGALAPTVFVEVRTGTNVVLSTPAALNSSGAFATVLGPLADGSYELVVQATDDAAQVSERRESFSVGAPPPPPPGVTATLTEHIQAGRLSWAQFGTYYLEYGTAAFTLYQQADGSWSDEPGTASPDAGISPDAGPVDSGVVADSGVPADTGMPPDTGIPPDTGVPADSGVPPDSGVALDAGAVDSGSTCQDFTSNNYQHVQAGRASVCNGGYVCAVGSGTQLGLYNTFYTSTVAMTAPGYYEAGPCP